MITAHPDVTETVCRAPSVVRWEGDNLGDVITFLGKIPARLEIVDERLRITVRSGCGFTLESNAVELDIFLREGDGLTYTPVGISVIRELVYSDERPRPNEKLH